MVAYSDNHLIDTDHRIFVDVDASRSVKIAEAGASRGMTEWTTNASGCGRTWWRLTPLTAPQRNSPSSRCINKFCRSSQPFTNRGDRMKRGHLLTLPKIQTENRYLCPEGKEPKRIRQNHQYPRNKQSRTGRRKYRASKTVCGICPAKEKCTPKVDARSVIRERYEEVLEFAHHCIYSQFNAKN